MLAGILLIGLPCALHAQEKYPASWRKTMTNDPVKNTYLSKFSRKLATPEAETLRNLKLSKLAGGACEGSSINKKKGTNYLKSSGYFALKGKAWDDAAFLAESEFRYLDFRSLAHLCAGIDYLVGPHGVLIIDVVSPGTGEPRGSYDPANPYIRIEPLPKPAG
ncbi:hypothetical protein B5P45_00055 [Phyllobacterium zundukense]|uniref:Uncharacterized protein n=1 Tax=Phyllobacterium zundukense TaxID=1867719 RepID=A0A2N9W576_9HYPH|nr:hypothetical protein BLM14_21100 [Phyllobacterium zundukense]PIO46894.1 hypothetical protein B5P45_00055 [Phyllobacterium zundukense]